MIILKCLCYICCAMPIVMALLFNDFVDLYNIRSCFNDKHLFDVKLMVIESTILATAITVIIDVLT